MVCHFRCMVSVLLLLKALLQIWHIYFLSPLCASMCIVKFSACGNNFIHNTHMCGFSPVWDRWWGQREPLVANDSWHNWHLYGFSPVWVLKWRLRVLPLANDFGHNWHLYGFSPVWVLKCWLRVLPSANDFGHNWHMYGLSPVCVLVWEFSRLLS